MLWHMVCHFTLVCVLMNVWLMNVWLLCCHPNAAAVLPLTLRVHTVRTVHAVTV